MPWVARIAAAELHEVSAASMIPVIVISLVRSTDRRAHMMAHLKAIRVPFVFFDAVDGEKLSQHQRLQTGQRRIHPRRYNDPMLPAEIGCAMSYQKLCVDIMNGPDEFVCVLEDDVTVDGRLGDFLDEKTLRRLPRFDVLRLHDSNSSPCASVARWDRFEIRAPYRAGWGSHAQIFSRRGAAKAAAALADPSIPIDMMLFYDREVANFRILEIHPPLAAQTDAYASTIDPEHTRLKSRPRPPLLWRWRFATFEFTKRIRLFLTFVRHWGLGALMRLRP